MSARVRLEMPPRQLQAGDYVEVSGEGECFTQVLAVEPIFNPAFVPVRLAIDPHYAVDIDRDSLIAAWRVVPVAVAS